MVRIKPSKEDLERMYIVEELSVKRLSEKFHVAKDTVKNWIINYNIDYRGFGPRKISRDFIRPSKEELYNLYNKQKLTLREIGKKYNVTKTTIKRWFNFYRLKVRSDPSEARLKGTILPSKEQLIKDYKHLSIQLIADKYDTSTETILTLLDKHGIQKRNRAESKRLAEKTGRFVSWNKGKGMDNPKVAEMMKNLHKKQMEKMPEIRMKVSNTKKRLFAEGKIKSWNKGKTGVFSEEAINKIRMARLKQRFKREDNKLEKLMGELLRKENLTEGLIKHYPLKFDNIGTLPDFAYLKYKVAIYCDGDYWHRLPKAFKRDAKQHFALWKNGWAILRFWEKDIKKHPIEVINEVKGNLFNQEFIKKREEQRKIFIEGLNEKSDFY